MRKRGPDTELKVGTWTELALIAERARVQPQCQFAGPKEKKPPPPARWTAAAGARDEHGCRSRYTSRPAPREWQADVRRRSHGSRACLRPLPLWLADDADEQSPVGAPGVSAAVATLAYLVEVIYRKDCGQASSGFKALEEPVAFGVHVG